MQCPTCFAQNPDGARFCSECAKPFTVVQAVGRRPSAAKKYPWWVFAFAGFGAVCVLCCGSLLIIGQGNRTKLRTVATPTPARTPAPMTVLVESSPTPSPAPMTVLEESSPTPPITTTPTPTPHSLLAELKAQAAPLLKLNKDETDAQMKRFDQVMSDVAAVPKDSPDYAAAQALQKQLSAKVAPVLAERLLLGEKPANSAWDGRVDIADAYLKLTLNDYDSAEYLGWTPVARTTYKKAPCWMTTVRLRAKNAFGAFIVRNMTFYIQQGRVVDVK